MSPVALGASAGWLHAGHADTGVVICGAQGFEALCTRQSLRILADRIAQAGPDALRFDYPGEGDSLDLSVEEPVLAAWTGSIRRAAAYLREERGARRIVLVGQRLGALLALEAARSMPDLDAIVLIAPPATGAAYLREIKATARMLAATKMGCAVTENGVELCGFASGAAHSAAFAALKPAVMTRAPAPMLLLAEPAERPSDALAEALESTGAAVERLSFEGCADMLAAPTAAVAPRALFDRIAAWLAQPAVAGGGRPSPASATLAGEGYCEERLQFGDANGLCGVLCEPEGARRGTLVILNAGAISHVGWARSSVEHARRLARQGIASFRIDLTGIGDSVWTVEGPRPLLYSRQHVADVRAALDVLEARGHSGFALMGLCAGGYAALHAAHQDERVTAVLPVNVDKLVWHDHYDIDVIEQELNQSSASYAAQAFSSNAWKRVLSGDVSAQRVVAILKLLSSKAIARMAEPISAAVGYEPGLSDDDRFIRSVFADLARRGVRVRLVYADRDPGIDELDRHMGVQARYLRKFNQVAISVIADADHEFTPAAAREALLEQIVACVTGSGAGQMRRAA